MIVEINIIGIGVPSHIYTYLYGTQLYLHNTNRQ